MTTSFFDDGDDEDDTTVPQDDAEPGDYDLGDDVGEKIGEHQEDPSL